MMLENQQQQTILAEIGTFALYTNKPGKSNLIHQNSTSFRKTRYLPRPNFRNQQFAPRNNPAYQPFAPRNSSAYQPFTSKHNTGFPTKNHPASNQQAPMMNQNTTHQQLNPNVNAAQVVPRPAYQICGKNNHSALNCYHQMDCAFQGRHPSSELATMVAHLNEEFGAQKWLADSGVNAHIAANAANIHETQPFEGVNMEGVGNGAGLNIKQFGSFVVQSPSLNCPQLLLKDILHCPYASTNLISINKFCIDKNCWFALTGSNFIVKENLTGSVLLQGPNENGLYPIPLHQKSLNKWKGFEAYIGVKTTHLVWHQRLGHPSTSVVQHLLKNQQLPFTGSLDKTRVCEAC
jgi:hypothetical protein